MAPTCYAGHRGRSQTNGSSGTARLSSESGLSVLRACYTESNTPLSASIRSRFSFAFAGCRAAQRVQRSAVQSRHSPVVVSLTLVWELRQVARVR